MREFDYIIIGGGCAGLSLAYELEIHEKFKNKTFILNKKRAFYFPFLYKWKSFVGILTFSNSPSNSLRQLSLKSMIYSSELCLEFIKLIPPYLEKYAIIFSTKIEIKADPNERSENLLTLHLGTKVRIIDNFKDEWVKIKLVNGQEGWIKNNQIKII